MYNQKGFAVFLLIATILIVGLVGGTLYVAYKDSGLIAKFLPSMKPLPSISSKLSRIDENKIVNGKTVKEWKADGETRFNVLKDKIFIAFPQNKYPQIISQLAVASSARILPGQYKAYQILFSDMEKVYGQTKDQKMKVALADLKDYVTPFPDYVSRDFSLPD